MRKLYRFKFGVPYFLIALLLGLAGCGVSGESDQVGKAIGTIREADREYDLRHVDRARTLILQALKISAAKEVYFDGSYDESFGQRGVIAVLSAHGDYSFLVDCVNKALADPKCTDRSAYLDVLGDAFDRLGRKAESRAAFAQVAASLSAEAAHPGIGASLDRPITLNLADAQCRAGQYAEAAKNYDTVRRLYPNYAGDASNSQAYLCAVDGVNLAQSEKLALFALKQASTRGTDIDLAEYQDTLGWVYYRMWLIDKSKIHLAQAVTYLELGAAGLPAEADCQYHLAKAYEAAGRLVDASIEYTRIANMHQADPVAQSDARRLAGAVSPSASPSAVSETSV